MTFGQRLKNLRLLAGLSQERLANLTGMTQRAICAMESGQSKPRQKTLMRLSLVLGKEAGLQLIEFPK